jgi:hypothetical protein
MVTRGARHGYIYEHATHCFPKQQGRTQLGRNFRKCFMFSYLSKKKLSHIASTKIKIMECAQLTVFLTRFTSSRQLT